ncbi:MAG: BlaI/MecI/CopY family transcriptional regulator [Proteocatella sp.]
MLQQVSDFELELMKIIWANEGTALYAEIVEVLETKGIPATKNTIISLLSRLIEKGFLKTNKIGRRNRYTAVVSEEQYRSAQTENFLDKIYEGNAKELISTLIQNNLISADDYERLKKYWSGDSERKGEK